MTHTVITAEMWQAWQNDPVTQEIVAILKEESQVKLKMLSSTSVLESPNRFTVAAFVQFVDWLTAYIEAGVIDATNSEEKHVEVDFQLYLNRRLGN